MGERIGHHCAVALIHRLKREREGAGCLWRLSFLLEKQHNRGQDGVGIAVVAPVSGRYHLWRRQSTMPVFELMEYVGRIGEQEELPWAQIWLGHLRYGTFGGYGEQACHPAFRSTLRKESSLFLAGNFNLTNIPALEERLRRVGGYTRGGSDVELLVSLLAHAMEETGSLEDALRREASYWDGGWALVGATLSGYSFAFRDPHAIRPLYWACDGECIVCASERPPIAMVFGIPYEEIYELEGGAALIVWPEGNYNIVQILPVKERRSCSFERIYFSRPSDPQIWREREQLGYNLAPAVYEEVREELSHTVFSYIPNTAEFALRGLVRGIEELSGQRVRTVRIATKDHKLRTFITRESARTQLTSHIYDLIANTVEAGRDTLVVVDDSIVRGNTLRNSILGMLAMLEPARIVLVSSAPQIRYPDCYGIDMSTLGELVAFRAALSLLKDSRREELVEEVYERCVLVLRGEDKPYNPVRLIYEPFTVEQISRRVCELCTPEGFHIPFRIIYQSIEGLRKAIPNHRGDWYFTGDYPTSGGYLTVCRAFVNFVERRTARPYEKSAGI